MTLVAFNKCVLGEREREKISLERERDGARGRERDLLLSQVRDHAVLTKDLPLQTLPICRREREKVIEYQSE